MDRVHSGRWEFVLKPTYGRKAPCAGTGLVKPLKTSYPLERARQRLNLRLRAPGAPHAPELKLPAPEPGQATGG